MSTTSATPAAAPSATAIILGASGSVGRALWAEAVRPGRFAQVIAVVRQPLGLAAEAAAGGPAAPRASECLVPDMRPDALRQAVIDALRPRTGPAVGFSTLGVGAGTAQLTLEQHRAVDVALNAAFAAGLQASGKVRHLVFMSAVGADIHARTTGSGAAGMPRYARVKGEAEQAVCSQGLGVVSIFRPSVIIGSVHTPGIVAAAASLAAPLLPARYRPIRADEIARAMVAVSLATPAATAVYGHAEMKALGAGLRPAGETGAFQ